MRGNEPKQPSMLALVSLEGLVPPDHPLRRLKPLIDEILASLDPVFDGMYASTGRPSVPPERLLKSMVLMALYGLRSERLFCEQLAYNMLFRWFLDMDMVSKPFDPSTFSKNRERLLEHDVAGQFFQAIVERAREAGLLSSEHFAVDGTQIRAWASIRGYRPRDDESEYDSNQFRNFKGEKLSRETHVAVTEPEAFLWRKGNGKEATLSYMAHAMIETDNGLVTDLVVSEATGMAERDAALEMVDRENARREKRRKGKKRVRAQKKKTRRKNKKRRRFTLAADKAYDTYGFVAGCRERHVTPHVVQRIHRRKPSAIDGRTTRHDSYRTSLRKRLLVEKVFGWMKDVAGFQRSRYRGRRRTELAAVMTAATYNITRLINLLAN